MIEFASMNFTNIQWDTDGDDIKRLPKNIEVSLQNTDLIDDLNDDFENDVRILKTGQITSALSEKLAEFMEETNGGSDILSDEYGYCVSWMDNVTISFEFEDWTVATVADIENDAKVFIEE